MDTLRQLRDCGCDERYLTCWGSHTDPRCPSHLEGGGYPAVFLENVIFLFISVGMRLFSIIMSIVMKTTLSPDETMNYCLSCPLWSSFVGSDWVFYSLKDVFINVYDKWGKRKWQKEELLVRLPHILSRWKVNIQIEKFSLCSSSLLSYNCM